MKNIFAQGPLLGVRLLGLIALSIVIAVLDVNYGVFDRARDGFSSALAPVYWLVNAPGDFADWGGDLLESDEDLLAQNQELNTRLLVLEAKTQKMASMMAELNRMRELLNASSIVDDSVLVAEIIGVNPDPFLHEVVINKGKDLGVYSGQPVLDPQGLMGQITEVQSGTSRALLISDSSHAVPVQVLRNGIRGLLRGTGALDSLQLVNMPDTADVAVGDLLISSGLGGRFPAGYPVAEVVKVRHDPGEPFAEIVAHPLAELNRSRHVLLVYRRREGSAGTGVVVPPP